MDLAATSPQPQVSADVTHIDCTGTGLRRHASADIVDVYSAAAAFSFEPSGNTRRDNFSALSFDFHEFDVARDAYRQIGREFVRRRAFPLADQPGSVALDVRVQSVRLELTARAVLRRFVGFVVNGVADALRRPALHAHRARFHLNAKVSDALE